MLVLCILAMLTAFIWPAVHRMFLNQGLRIAADQVRTMWLQARNDAMNTGRVQRFMCDPISGTYRVESGVLESNAEASAGATGEYVPPVREDKLPEGIRFVTMDTASNSRDTAARQTPGGFGTGEELSSTPVFFYPDGAASDARLILGNTQGRGIAVSLRGLTGAVIVGEITTLDNGVLP